jgi:hypothetical protein
MKTILHLTLLSIFSFIALFDSAFGQSETDSSKKNLQSVSNETLILVTDSTGDTNNPESRSHFEAGLSYQNNDVYLGRKDSTVLPYYIPVFTYYHKSGLFATFCLNYLKNSTASRIDLVTLEAGYQLLKGGYEAQFTASKYFYSSQSTSVTSEISASLAYENSFDFGFIKPFFTATLNISSQLDIEGLFGLEHSFYLLSGKMDFTPTFAMAGSTQNYYNNYYKKRRYNIKKEQKSIPGVSSISGTVLNASDFKILDFEPTIPINYRIGKCTINFSPTYSIPVHPATVAIQAMLTDGTILNRVKTEKIENSFYWTLGVSFLF